MIQEVLIETQRRIRRFDWLVPYMAIWGAVLNQAFSIPAVRWCSWLSRLLHTQAVTSSSLVRIIGFCFAAICL